MLQTMRSLGRARAERAGDARAWTPAEMLQDAHLEVQAGVISPEGAILIIPTQDGGVLIRRAGVSPGEEFELIRAAMKQISGI